MSAQGTVAEPAGLLKKEADLQAVHTWPRAPLNPALAAQQECRKDHTYYMYIAGAPRWRAPFFPVPTWCRRGVGQGTRR